MKIDRIDQFVAGFSLYDAISNETVLMQAAIHELGFHGDIFAEHIHSKAAHLVKPFQSWDRRQRHHTKIIYHFSIGSAATAFLAHNGAQIHLRYHNLTPKEFFPYVSDHMAYSGAMAGGMQLQVLSNICGLSLADSHYNKSELVKFGLHDVTVVPILRDYEKLKSERDDDELLKVLKTSDSKNLLFVGRVVANKCQHDLIKLTHIYRQVIDPNVRLFLAGSFFSQDYKNHLLNYCEKLGCGYSIGLNDINDQTAVVFLPETNDAQLKTLFANADLLLCMSDHEGFCVPLVEAMAFGLPIVAHDCTAVTETLGQAGMLMNKTNTSHCLELLHKVLTDASVRQSLVESGYRRYDSMALTANVPLFKQFVSSIA